MTSMATMKYGGGLAAYGPTHRDESAAANGAVTTAGSHSASVNGQNPMVWLVGIGALTLGLIAFSTHVRVGNIRAGVDAGTP